MTLPTMLTMVVVVMMMIFGCCHDVTNNANDGGDDDVALLRTRQRSRKLMKQTYPCPIACGGWALC